MNTPITRQEFLKRLRSAKRLAAIMVVVAILPGFAFGFAVAPLGKAPLLAGLSNQTVTAIGCAGLVWLFAILFGPFRSAWKSAGLYCPKCNRVLEGASFEAVLKTGRCNGCSQQILSD